MGNSQTSTGRKKAVLIGINYPGTGKRELPGCDNDVRRVNKFLVDHYGFSKDDITILMDTDDSFEMPTGRNIRAAIQRLVFSAKPHDTLFIHYSGHGGRKESGSSDDDDTGYDEYIFPSDGNLIYDAEIREIMDQVPEDCKLTMVADSCRSGGLIQNLKEQIGNSTKQPNIHRKLEASKEIEDNGIETKIRYLPFPDMIEMLKQKIGRDDISVENVWQRLYEKFGEDASPIVKNYVKGKKSIPHQHSTQGTVRAILLTGCQSDQFSAGKKSGGVFTNAILNILENSSWQVSNHDLVRKAREVIASKGYKNKQHPGLYCDDRYLNDYFIGDAEEMQAYSHHEL